MVMRGMAAAVLLWAATATADDPPVIEHQPTPCSVPDKRVSLCASVTDEGQVASVRTYFRARGERFYSFVDMAFAGLSYCGALPAPREKTKAVEYYVQAMDDEYQPQRTSTHVMQIEPEGVCEFPPVATGAEATGTLVVHATHAKQGQRLSKAFDGAGVSYVAVGRK
jgi:hypothetical protein